MKFPNDPLQKSAAQKSVETNTKIKPKNRDWLGALLWLSVAIVGLTLGRLGVIWPSFDVFSQFFMIFALLLIGSFFALCLPRLKGLGALAITLVLIIAYGLWPLLQKSGAEEALTHGEKRLSIASFNVHSGSVSATNLANEVQNLNPDVFAIIEFHFSSRVALASLKTRWPYQIEDCSYGIGCRFAIISKFPITLGKASHHLMSANLGPSFGNTEIVAIHTSRFPFSKIQAQQFKEIGDAYALQSGNIIFLGDFNATPFSVLLKRFADRMGLNLLTSLPTWPANQLFPFLPIDHILASKGVRTIDQQTLGNSLGSDHFPIRQTLAVKVLQN